jgi:hypothetical protein
LREHTLFAVHALADQAVGGKGATSSVDASENLLRSWRVGLRAGQAAKAEQGATEQAMWGVATVSHGIEHSSVIETDDNSANG